MHTLSRGQRFVLKPVTTIAAAALLLLVGIFAMVYQFRSANAERLRQVTAQATTLAASVTAALAFNDQVAAREYVDALMLDPRVAAVAVFNESGALVAGKQRAGQRPITRGRGQPRGAVLVDVPARQGTTVVGSVWVRGAATPWTMQLARLSGVALLTVMAVVMLSVLGIAQRMLTHANAAMRRRAEELAEANRKLQTEMERRSRTEEALRQSQKMEAVGQLSGGIAHDFNNVLMTVRAALTLLAARLAQNASAVERFAAAAQARIDAGGREDPAAVLRTLEEGMGLVAEGRVRREQITHYMETANHGIDKAADLTKRLLAFARKQPLAAESVHLDALVRGMETLLEHSIGAAVRIQYQLNSSWHVSCDVNQMENAVLNLVINARDAMPDGGQITIATRDVAGDGGAGDEHVELRVSDTGTGMTDEVRTRAMDPFFTTKPVGKGTGLGLSTILGYVLQSHGALDIESTVGVGTTVRIALPREVDKVSGEVA